MLAHSPTRPSAKELQILAAARAAFLEMGYAATSMDLVAQQARVSKTTLYTRYPSKEALFAAVIHAECEHYPFIPAEEFLTLPPSEALRRIGLAFLTLILSPAAIRVFRIVIAESDRFPELAQTFHQSGPQPTKCAIHDYMAEAKDRGLLAIEDPTFAACQFLASLEGDLHFTILMGIRPPPTAEEIETQVARAVKLFLDGALPR